MSSYNSIVVLGPTASGKTQLACRLADRLDGEIISADSRQVYTQLDIGTGKDLDQYQVNGKIIPYHLIDLVDPAEQFYLHQFASELKKAFDLVLSKNKVPIICGGTGLYLDALRKDFSFTQIKENEALREELGLLSKEELTGRLKKYAVELTAHIDRDSRKRLIRGIEIAEYRTKHEAGLKSTVLPYQPYYIGIRTEPETRRELIRKRLLRRMDEGLIDEVENLLRSGITHHRLEFLGLEYKFVSYYLQNKIGKEELIAQLQTAICQFARRQMTWFRKMEKEGVTINWIPAGNDGQGLLPLLEETFGKRI